VCVDIEKRSNPMLIDTPNETPEQIAAAPAKKPRRRAPKALMPSASLFPMVPTKSQFLPGPFKIGPLEARLEFLARTVPPDLIPIYHDQQDEAFLSVGISTLIDTCWQRGIEANFRGEVLATVCRCTDAKRIDGIGCSTRREDCRFAKAFDRRVAHDDAQALRVIFEAGQRNPSAHRLEDLFD
jgi:hypothetical protein